MKKYLITIFICFLILCNANEGEINKKLKILIGSPVNRKPQILNEFLNSLKRLEKESCVVDYFFVDHNNSEESEKLLKDFQNEFKTNCLLLQVRDDTKFVCNEIKHFWNQKIIDKITTFKDHMILKALNENYDYLFLIDSDLVLHPKTLKQLIKADKDILSNIFWTITRNGVTSLPQVWASDDHTRYKHQIGEKLTQQEINKRTNDFNNMLKKPGTYEVGGLGACTLISKKALQKGVSFQKISNLSFYGEDKHFCVRAVASGLSLFVDTHYPAYHIYRESDLAGVDKFVKKCEEINIEGYDPSQIKSRFIYKMDPQMRHVAEFPISDEWKSRRFEYKWASQFVKSYYTVLDAGCGIEHPFKWLLAETCLETWACDINPQILERTNLFVKKEDKKIDDLDLHKMMKVKLVCSSICNLPLFMPEFDLIFCISTLDCLSVNDRKKALEEFARTLTPDGFVIITVGYPTIIPEDLLKEAESVGLIPAGDVEIGSPTEEALNIAPVDPKSYIYRCVLKHK